MSAPLLPLLAATLLATARRDEPVTWAGSVAALLDRHCVVCHRPGQSAPFSLADYDSARSRARQMVKVTQSGFMPPWLPETGLGFANERRLTEAEKELLVRWADGDAPQGDPALRPPPPVFAPGWHLGEPDLVLTVDAPYVLPATGSDVYRNLVVPVPLTESRYVCAVELRPGNPKVVHHAVLFVDRNRHCRVTDAADPGIGFGGMDLGEAQSPDGHFVGWTPGRLPLERNEARAWELPAGADLLLQLHLLPSGKPEEVAPQIGLYFSKQPPTERPFLLRIGSKTMEIAAGDANYVVEDRYRLPIDVAVLGIYPHAHYLARRMSSEALLPDGTTRRLLAIGDWDFNWQDEYRYAAPIELPAGSELSMRYVFDNSADNPRNPTSPPVRVTFGARSSDEMADLWIQVLPKDSAQRADLERDFLKRDYRQHLASLELAVREAPTSAAAHHDLGLGLHLAGRNEEALASLRRALELDPRMSAAHNNLGIVLMDLKRPDEALPHFEAAVASDSRNANAHNSLGLVLRDRGLLARALGSFQRAVDLDPTHASALRGLGGTLARLGRFAEAEAPLRRALALEPAWLDAEYDLALVLEATRRSGEACIHYRRVLAQKKDPAAAERLAWILACHPDATKRAPEEALRWARNLASIATDESRPRVTDLVGAAQAAAGRYSAAVASAEKALQLARDRQDQNLAKAIEQRLAAYRMNQPWTEARFAEQ